MESIAFNNSVHDFKATDNVAAVQANRIFYRLKLVDKDGRFSYSKVIAFYVNSQNRFIVYPNPARTEMFISMIVDKKSNVQIKIIDASGRTVGEQERTIEKGNNVFPVNTLKLKNGNYILKVINDGETRSNKFTIVN